GSIPRPYQRPHPPIVVTAVAPFSKGVTEAAKRGWSPISANFLQPNWVASHWPKYAEGCADGPRAADPADWRVAKSIFVADDEATAQRYAKRHDGPYAYYFKSLMTKLIRNGRPELFKSDRSMPDSAITLDYVLDSLVICGTVDSVVEQLLAFRATVGDFGTLLYAGHDWADPALARRSMELMATEVMPRVNAAIAAAGGAARSTSVAWRVAQRVGVVGLGIMGFAYAAHLIDAGFITTGFDVDPDALRRFEARGGPPAAD